METANIFVSHDVIFYEGMYPFEMQIERENNFPQLDQQVKIILMTLKSSWGVN